MGDVERSFSFAVLAAIGMKTSQWGKGMKLPCVTLAFCFIAAAQIPQAQGQSAESYESLIQRSNTQLLAGSNADALTLANLAIKTGPGRWEAYAVAGGALLNLKRYEEAADDFSKAIERAPEGKQPGLRDLRKRCLLAESGLGLNEQSSSASNAQPSAAMAQAEIALWKSIENSEDPADFQAYLNQYPHGAFVALAQSRLTSAEEKAKEAAQHERDTETWTDSQAGLMWTRNPIYQGIQVQDRDKVLLSNSNYFYDFLGDKLPETLGSCSKLHLANYSDWRIPTVHELDVLTQNDFSVLSANFTFDWTVYGKFHQNWNKVTQVIAMGPDGKLHDYWIKGRKVIGEHLFKEIYFSKEALGIHCVRNIASLTGSGGR